MKSVAVIGAGAAGLCMARYLSAEPKLFKVVVYEQGGTTGGTWIYDQDIPAFGNGPDALVKMKNNDHFHSSMYQSLRYISIRIKLGLSTL